MTDTLTRFTLMKRQAQQFGFVWTHVSQILDQIQSECQEIQDVISQQEERTRLQEEVGDLILAAFSLCLFLGFDGEETFIKAINKFEKRFRELKNLAHKLGYETLCGQSIEIIIELWKQAKQRTSSPPNETS